MAIQILITHQFRHKFSFKIIIASYFRFSVAFKLCCVWVHFIIVFNQTVLTTGNKNWKFSIYEEILKDVCYKRIVLLMDTDVPIR